MAIPATAQAFAQALDPSDLVDFHVIISQGEPDAKIPTVLLVGEAVADYSLGVTPEAAAVGLSIVEREGYQNRLVGNVLSLWLEVDASMRGAAIFNGLGVTVAIELIMTTTSDPARIKQRSFLVRIANQ